MAWTNNTTTGIGLSTVPEIGGTGWDIWYSDETNPGGDTSYFTEKPYYNSTGGLYPYIGSNDYANSCFAISALSPSIIRAGRYLRMPLSVGGHIEFRMGINFRSGFKGVRLLEGGPTGSLSFLFQAASNKYEWTEDGTNYYTLINTPPGGGSSTPWNYQADSVFSIRIDRTDFNDVDIKLRRINTVETNPLYDKFEHTINTECNINYVEFFSSAVGYIGVGTQIYQNSLFFNYLTGYSAYR